MITPHRERHLLIWAILAVLLPAGVVAAYLAIPKKAIDRVPVVEQAPALENVITSADDEYFHVNYRGSTEGMKQLEVIIKMPLTIPSALVYISETEAFNPNDALLAGELDSKGVYRFALPAGYEGGEHFTIVFYDFIKKKTFRSLNIQ